MYQVGAVSRVVEVCRHVLAVPEFRHPEPVDPGVVELVEAVPADAVGDAGSDGGGAGAGGGGEEAGLGVVGGGGVGRGGTEVEL